MIANLQTLGPTYVTDARGEILDHSAGMLLAARIVISAGMGNNVKGLGKLNGPLPISELDLDKGYEVYFYPVRMKQQPLPKSEFSTGKGTFIVCLIIPEEIKNSFRPFEELMEKVLVPYRNSIDFSETISGEVPQEVKDRFKDTLNEIYIEINQLLEFASKFEGGSLFDIGLIATLPDKLSKTAKKIMLHPKGILEEEISDKTALKTLYQSGLIEREERDGRVLIIPK